MTENTTNKIAGRINRYIRTNIDESNHCMWTVYYAGFDTWAFNMEFNGNLVWYTGEMGSVEDLLLTALQGLERGEWKKKKED